jgi:hypothetical protein
LISPKIKTKIDQGERARFFKFLFIIPWTVALGDVRIEAWKNRVKN